MNGIFGDRTYLYTTIRMRARLEKSMANVKDVLSLYPAMILVKEGKNLTYRISEENMQERHYVFTVGNSALTFSIYSNRSPLNFMRECLVRIFGILNSLAGLYKIEFGDLYPYLIEVLSVQELDYYKNKLKLTSSRTFKENTDLLLAKRLFNVLNENKRLVELYNFSENKSIRLLSEIIVLRYGHRIDAKKVAHDMKVDENDIYKALKTLDTAEQNVPYLRKVR